MESPVSENLPLCGGIRQGFHRPESQVQVLRSGLAAMARNIFHDFRLILTFVKEYSNSYSHNFMWGEVI